MAESKLTWSQWLEGHKVSEGLIRISPELGDSSWDPTDKDREAAWILYTELRTRITTQPLHYRSGDEETALKSLYDLFDLTRKTIEDKGPECRHFATIAIQVLNTHIRPLTAKWHKKKIAGRLQNDDDRREFRQELQTVRVRLVEFCRLLANLAEADACLDLDACGSGPGNGGAGKTNAIGHAIPFDRILLVDQVPGGADLLDGRGQCHQGAASGGVSRARHGARRRPRGSRLFRWRYPLGDLLSRGRSGARSARHPGAGGLPVHRLGRRLFRRLPELLPERQGPPGNRA